MLTAPGSRKSVLPNSQRWAARTPSQVKRRQQWVPPDLNQMPERLHSISSYSDKGYVIGNSSRTRLRIIADRFTGKKPSKNDMRDPVFDYYVELSSVVPSVGLPWDSEITSCDQTDLSELHGSSREVSELPDSQPADLGKPDLGGGQTGLTASEVATAEQTNDTIETLVEERRILDDMKRDIEHNEYYRAIQESRREAGRAVQENKIDENDEFTRAISQSQLEAEERRLLQDMEKEAEDVLVAEAIKESEAEVGY